MTQGQTELSEPINRALRAANAPQDCSFLVFVREWWDGRAHDALVLFHDQKHGHVYCSASGDSLDGTPPRVLRAAGVPVSMVEKHISLTVKAGFLTIPSQEQRIIITHFSDHYAIRCSDGSAHSFFVRGGKHADRRAGEILHLILKAEPRLAEFYERNL